MSEAHVSSCYQSDKPFLIQCGSSQSSFGVLLLHNGRSVDYRNATLLKAEKNCAQLEKEMLTVEFALERFNSYTFGRKKVVITNH